MTRLDDSNCAADNAEVEAEVGYLLSGATEVDQQILQGNVFGAIRADSEMGYCTNPECMTPGCTGC